ncbi:T9SS outer membrane translocon Sov/SprA [Cloacibacterium rupense]|nr:cell surface protein SprA [Cloacibacterium rupense]
MCFSAMVFAQQKPADTANISIRKDYSLPNPTKYEPFYDIKTGMYYLYPKIGNTVVGAPIVLSPKEYSDYFLNKQLTNYYQKKLAGTNLYKEDKKEAEKKGLIPAIMVRNKIFETIFGSNKIEIIPNGFASFDLGGLYQKIDNPLILPQNRTNFAINIQQRIQLGLTGKVGENLQLKANYDTQSGFAFENRMNLVWQAKGTWKDLQNKALGEVKDFNKGGEDKIIKRVEFGNVNMPLSTNLIRGSESLFGLKTEFQLGKTYGTVVFSQQQGEARNVVVQGGGVMQTFKVNAIDYEDNQHYFLGQYFLNNYDGALLNYPLINSRISIMRLEVWVLNQGAGNLQEQKNILGIRDLGEGSSGTPDNSQSGVYSAISSLPNVRVDPYNAVNGNSLPTVSGNTPYQAGEHFVFHSRAKRLNASEYNFNPQLGYISLNQRLNDEQLLAVSFSYTLSGDSKVYKVGEFSEESPVIITKLLKPNVLVKTSSPMWNLMMKNVYSLNANQIDPQNFLLNVLYKDPQNGKVNYLPGTSVSDINLLKLLNWDRLNVNNDSQQNGNGTTGDGLFDFVPGITADAQNGRVIFTKAQPFGSYLQSVLGSNNPQFVFEDLYTQQKQVASQNNLALRYSLEGRYKGAQGTGISLGAINVPKGSVKVTANGVLLTEGVDYTVDYMLGQVTIINEMVKQSGQAINVSLENQLTFNTQRKTFMGLNLERKFSDNLTAGISVINYSERPLTQKVQMGQESVNNTMAGFNLMYNNQSQFLTRITDKIPFVNTEAPSNINFKMEGAYLIPGQNKGINDQSYIDDFEQSASKISLKEPAMWSLASKPENSNDPIFGNSNPNDINNGNGRGLLSWYTIDPRFYGVGGKAPNGINADALSNHASRRVQMSELFNNRDFVAGEQLFSNTFDITYYPKERGPYNFNQLNEAANQRWAGLMRAISVSNFVNSNIEYVEFWMMDPYADGKPIGTNPRLLLQLGNVSEDILKDGKLQYENGLPIPNIPAKTSTTNLGVQPEQFPVLYAFSTENEERTAQDVGFDGLDDDAEVTKFGTNFINPVTNAPDPASDNFMFYLSDQFQGALASSLQERYRYFRNPDGNSKSNSLEVASQTPDAEDVNKDLNLDQTENYNQYNISLLQSDLAVGRNNIVDMKEVTVKFQNGQTSKNKWYLFRIPVANYDYSTETNATDAAQILNNVRFSRLMLAGFDNTSTIRFGTFDLVRSDWRKYTKQVFSNSVPGTSEGVGTVDNADFEVGSVNIEENALGKPPYVLPPGIDRQVLSGNAGAQRQNEASLYLRAKDFKNEARGVFKNVALDMRRFQNLELFVHAEDMKNNMSSVVDKDAKFFIRFGSDATDNYYEYESSLKYTNATSTSPLDIWPTENTVNLAVQNFVDAKLRKDESGVPIDTRYEDTVYGDADKKIYVKGRPSLGNVSTIMIGVRNNSASSKDVVLWVNEIRLSGIENKGGYAGTASLNFNLGDFAVVNASGAYSTIGFGNINQKPSERAQTTNSAFGITTTVNVDKFLPEKIGLKIPVNYSYSQTTEDPKYNPLNDDVEFSKDPKKDELKKVARTFTQQRSLGVLNMRKERTNPNKKPKFYDVENISITAVYNDDFYRDIYTKTNFRQYLRGNIDYNFNFKPWVLRPFNKMVSDTAKSYKYLRWAKEVNFNLIPTRISFRTELDRNYNELEFRNIDALLNGNSSQDFDVIRNRNFFFGWQYNLQFALTKSLKLDISSATRTLNDNLNVNSFSRSSIFENPFRAGRPVLYNHKIQLNYKFPFEYLPYLDFLTAEVGYGTQYNWSARSTVLTANPSDNLGNMAQNTNNINATGSADFTSFFNKFNYFKKVNEVMSKRRAEIDSLNNAYTQLYAKKGNKKNFKSYTFKNRLKPLQAFAYALTSIKQVDFNYTENNGTVLPGILSSPNFYGYGQGIGGPTIGFLLGSQSDIRRYAIENSWISSSDLMTDAYSQLTNQTFNGNIQIQPINDFRIDVSFTRNYARNLIHNNFNKFVNSNNDFSFASELITFTNSNIIFGTSFTNGADIYNTIIENTKVISQSFGGVIGPDGYAEGYSKSNAYVLVPAFQAAIEGKTATKNDPTKSKFPMPNWKVVYSGLKNIPFINSKFSKFDVLHAYTSTYTATGIQRSVDYYNYQTNSISDPSLTGKDANGDFYNPYTFTTIGYVEEFSPLVGADVTMRNNMQFKFAYNRSRLYTLGLVNTTLTEDLGSEYVVGFGYILKDLKLKVRFKGKEKNLKSDLNIRADFSLRDNQTRISNFLLDDSQITGGQKLFSLKLTADYNISQNFNLRFFYDQMMTKYKISTAFPLSTIRAGLTATFNFGGGQGF